MMDWLESWVDPTVVAWLVGASVVMIVLGLVALPWVLVRLPTHLLVGPPHRVTPRHPALTIVRNIAGGVVLLAGVLMLVLPGQGVLTILAGLLLMDFPGKNRLVQKLVGRPTVFRAVNALRRRVGAPPLLPPTEDSAGAEDGDSGTRAPPNGDGDR
ncbi:MAG: hypothetical protein H6704_29260 [Myxococcales bacterium]|nr:hypothetical protein [Myxococcales bacterium]